MAARLGALAEEEATGAGTEFKQEPGTVRLANLADKDPLFGICFYAPASPGRHCPRLTRRP
ncbi:MAG: hypothetical protein R2932_17300 [Caldilineaceae bacterium]